jgi:hypothetical protein
MAPLGRGVLLSTQAASAVLNLPYSAAEPLCPMAVLNPPWPLYSYIKRDSPWVVAFLEMEDEFCVLLAFETVEDHLPSIIGGRMLCVWALLET